MIPLFSFHPKRCGSPGAGFIGDPVATC